MNTFYIMRGLSGSGKSTKAKELVSNYSKDYYICSADKYFIQADGTYNWNPTQLVAAHAWCFKLFRLAVTRGVKCIILDNTNLKRTHFNHYVQEAIEYDYQIVEVVVGQFNKDVLDLYASRNSHGVSKDVLERMLKNWEP